MIRVIIADDENRICMLIKRLIDWEKIGDWNEGQKGYLSIQ